MTITERKKLFNAYSVLFYIYAHVYFLVQLNLFTDFSFMERVMRVDKD